MTDALAARRGALALLAGVVERGAPIEEDALPAAIEGADRARALSLAREAARRIAAADAVLARFMKRPAEPPAREILRLGAVEMLAAGSAPHGVVGAAVELAKGAKAHPGLVNAVLRRVGAEGPAIWAKLDHPRLAAPEWLWKALRADWGKAGAASIADAHLSPAPLDLTPKDGDADALAARLGGAALPTGSVRLERPGRISALPGYEAGDWWAQDAAAAAPARLAGPGEGRRALDLCAAPGGKTMQLAAAGWLVEAVDADARRLERLRRNLSRTGLSAEVVEADALERRSGPYDLVLLDAPCSATGTIRRHPELPHLREGAGDLPALQRRLLAAAWDQTAPGGRLIFCTCSLLKAEGEAQANAFLKTHEDAEREPIAAEEVGDAAFVTPAGDFRARPDLWAERGGIDGFFAARFRRRA
ncbi:MAG: transcription antitermination factor NusB [Pseudomonadota bacterium]